jgi:hypothetical protein
VNLKAESIVTRPHEQKCKRPGRNAWLSFAQRFVRDNVPGQDAPVYRAKSCGGSIGRDGNIDNTEGLLAPESQKEQVTQTSTSRQASVLKPAATANWKVPRCINSFGNGLNAATSPP